MKSKWMITFFSVLIASNSFAQTARHHSGASLVEELELVPWSALSVNGDAARSLYVSLAKFIKPRKAGHFSYVLGQGLTCRSDSSLEKVSYQCLVLVNHRGGKTQGTSLNVPFPRMGAGNGGTL